MHCFFILGLAATQIGYAQNTSTSMPPRFFHHLDRPQSACDSGPTGSGPITTPDTPFEFLKSPAISSLAKSATLPRGYQSTFTNLHASIEGGSYLGYILLDSYNTTHCAT